MYYQVKEDIVNKIKSGVYKIEEKIPSENELKILYNVSLITINKALSTLVNEGYLYRIQGKGTFIGKPKIKRLLNLLSFTDELKNKGYITETKLLDFQVLSNPMIAEKLNISSDKLITKIKRLRIANGEPMALQNSYLPYEMVSKISQEELRLTESLYKVLEVFDIRPHRASEEYDIAVLNEKEICSLLDLKKGTPAFAVRRITYNHENVPFEYTESILRGDRYTIKVDLRGEF